MEAKNIKYFITEKTNETRSGRITYLKTEWIVLSELEEYLNSL